MAVVGCGSVKSPPLTDASIDAANGIVDGSVDSSIVRRWALLQAPAIENTEPGTLTVPVNTLGAGHLVIVGVQIEPAGRVSSMTDDAGNNYGLVPMSHSSSADMNVALELYYVANSHPGARAIEINATSNIPFPLIASAVVWEVSGIKTTDPVDIAAALNDQPESANPRGPRITTSAPGEFVVTAALADAEITGIHAGSEFVKDSLALGNGWAHLADPDAPAGVHQVQGDQTPPGIYCASAAAFRVGP